ncbi:ABC transporter substrate-binding protein [Desertihabitans brevis]|uniref:ABC transporter substrate-binding protein n=1 Tax=Desertihabitans brevis TaxID=2268447 RepID=A0A367YYV0_9ACTN|nr:ABC transporter substrate-binding protein [Desertihabitans brevis]RCK71024.1 ABC transporter substrate-binding protein [Desertihabitans brevis]
MKTRRIALSALSVLALTLAGCGSNSLSPETGGASPDGGSSAPETTVNEELAAALPQSVADSGVIRVGTDASYAPNEFLDADGETVIGMDVDLFDQVAAKFGVRAEYQPSAFDTIITGVQGGKYDIGVSSFTINEERTSQVTMVSYFEAGTQWATAAGNPEGVDPENPCGLVVAVQTGTVQQEEDLPAKQEACGDNPMEILSFDGQDQATNALAGGRADAMLADSPVVAYAVQQTGDQLETVGEVYDSAPYGYVVPNEEREFAEAIAQALTELQAEGGYTAALEAWNVQDGAVDTVTVQP